MSAWPQWVIGRATVRKAYEPSAIRRGRLATCPTWIVSLDIPQMAGCVCGKVLTDRDTWGVECDVRHGRVVRFMRKRDAFDFAEAHR